MKHLGEQESSPIFLDQGCIRVTWWVPRQCGKHQAPPAPGLYLRAGAAGLEGITRLSRGEVCPSSGAGTPPHPARAGGSPQSSFVPALERMDWRQPDRLSAGDTRDPAGQAEGRGTGGARIDGGNAETHSCASQGLVAPAAPAGDQPPLPTLCSPMDAPVSPGDAHTAPWTQLRCQGAPGVMSGHPGTGTDLWHCLQGMASWKSRSCSRLPSWKKPPWLAGKRVAGSVHSHFVQFPVLLSCLLSKG